MVRRSLLRPRGDPGRPGHRLRLVGDRAVLPRPVGRGGAGPSGGGRRATQQRGRCRLRRRGSIRPGPTRAALAEFGGPVLLVAGQVDLNAIPCVVAEYAEMFPNARLVVQREAGHYPWLDDAAEFVATVAGFLR
ncbi:MAG: alpha/beta fold hydrolase [Nocardioidaceae bacterium]